MELRHRSVGERDQNMATCNQIQRMPNDVQSYTVPSSESEVLCQPKLKLKCNRHQSSSKKVCLFCYFIGMVDGRHESDLTFAQATTMETYGSSAENMNQSTDSTEAPPIWPGRNCHDETNPSLRLDGESLNLANLHSHGDTGHVEGYPGFRKSRQLRGGSERVKEFKTKLTSRDTFQRSPMQSQYLWPFQVCLILVMMLAHLAQAGFWTFYFPNFLKPSGYSELTDMIESVEKQINSTIDQHADAMHLWRLMQKVDTSDVEQYYPEESACDQVFPLFRDRAIEYAEIDFNYYLEPLVSYREHLMSKRELWFPEGPKSKNILPRQYEHDLYKLDLELKIEAFNFLANDPKLRQVREQMVNIWRNVKRNLDSSLLCLYLRYAYRHMAADLNQFALDMNLKSLHQAMEMLESAYKRILRLKDQDMVAIEKIKDAMEREQYLVMV